MQEMGLEPTRSCPRKILSLVRLPIPPLLRANSILSVFAHEVKDKL